MQKEGRGHIAEKGKKGIFTQKSESAHTSGLSITERKFIKSQIPADIIGKYSSVSSFDIHSHSLFVDNSPAFSCGKYTYGVTPGHYQPY